MANWYSNIGPESDVIVSSRVRLARNIAGMPFCSKLTEHERSEINKRVKTAVSELNAPFAKGLKYIEMDNVPEGEIMAMVERHIISPNFAKNSQGRAIVISEDESISIMIGEEDHLRIQVLSAGLDIKNAYDIAERIDTLLCEKLRFAFHSELGYLTECPTNIGTGLRASVMLHLPMLSGAGTVTRLADAVSKIGFTVRGLYGEGSGSGADLYQLSNQITLGITEKDALDNLWNVAMQFVSQEKLEREKANRARLEDNIFRAYGILKNARILSSKEMMELVSLIKLGSAMGILEMDKTLPMKILVECQPNTLMTKMGVNDPDERDSLRAQIVRDLL